MDQHYTLSRSFGDADSPDAYSTFTVSNYDAINCAHMLAAGFNTMSRNMLNGWVLAVVDAKDGRVYYDGKSEQIKRDEPWSVSQTFNFEASPDGEHTVSFFDDENGRLIFPGKLKFTENTKAAETLAKSAAGHIARSVLEEAYAELQAVKEVLSDAGVETIPADAGATDLRAVMRARDAQIDELKAENAELHKRDKFEHFARSSMERKHFEQNEAARAEMISFVKRAHAKKVRLQAAVPDGDGRSELDDRWRGMLDVLAKFLVIIGEADADESHAVARRLCGIED